MASVSLKKKLSLFYWYHSFVKWILHLITGRCELERICCNIKCDAKCNFQIGYVDDISAAVESSQVEILLTHLNSIEASLQFIVERESNRCLTDLVVERKDNRVLETAVYPLFLRAQGIPSNIEGCKKEKEHVFNALRANDSPKKFFNICLQPVHRRSSTEDEISVMGFVVVPYVQEQSLKNSKSEALNEILNETGENIDASLKRVLRVKKINPEANIVFAERMSRSLKQIIGYNTFLKKVETLKRTPYCSNDTEHEDKLLELWSLLMPDKKLDERITTLWSEIGFQGKDPQTDFRGMGLLGLENLLYFARHQNNLARKVLNESHHPKYWYSFAIVGINISEMACSLLKAEILKSHFYNIVKGEPQIEDFHKVYCYLFRQFSSFWLAQKPASVMEFSRIKKEFNGNIITSLQFPETFLEIACSGADNNGYNCSLQSLSK